MTMEKTFDAALEEPEIYRRWEEAGAFRAGANARPGAESFCIMIPPPNVTGSLHMGHAFNNTLQDILVRWKRMQGFDVLWQPGQDHAGIATQMVVERELAREGLDRRQLGREKFLEKVWEWKEKSGGTIIAQLKRLGASCDWSRNRFTMDEGFQKAVIEAFVRLYEEGLIYRGKRLVNWDPKFETAISDLEVENIEVDGHMWHFKYPLAGGETYTYVEKDADGNVILEEERDYISIATTRPETMLGDGAVAVHPEDERYAPIVGKLVEIPVGPKAHRRLIPIIADEYPDPEFGSGAVKITGAHDFNDYEVARRHGIPLYRLMDTRARMRTDGLSYEESATLAGRIARGEISPDEVDIDRINLVPEELRGLDRYEARKRIIEAINAEGLAVTVRDAEGKEVPLVENKKIMQPFGDRSKVVIEPMLTDQWFVDTAKIVGPAIEAVKRGMARGEDERDGRGKPVGTKILPERDAKVYFHWLENIEPWCISRQLWWGHRIPVWYDDEGNAFCAPSFEKAAEKAKKHYREKHGLEVEVLENPLEDEGAPGKRAASQPYTFKAAWISEKPEEQEEAEPVVVRLSRDPDVLDTWFSSGIWPIGTLGWPEDTPELARYFPTDVLVTGFDIIFFWVARMMMMQYALAGERPFHTVYVHALVRDEKGRKMSKSIGNVIDPLELIDEFGADAVRFTLAAMAAMGRDLKLSKDRVKGYRNFVTKIWNAVRFAEMNGVYESYDTRRPGEVPAATATVNRWIIGETARAREAVDAALGQYRFNDAAATLYGFAWGTVFDWYVEFSKPLLQGEDAALAEETRKVMGWVLDQVLTLLHPFIPFVTEALWGRLGPRDKMLVHADWPTWTTEALLDAEADCEINWVIALVEGIRSARAQLRVPAGAKVDLLTVELDGKGREALDRNAALISRLARIGEIGTAERVPEGAVTVAVEGGLFALPLGEVIDIAAERARLEKTLAKLEKEVAGLEKRLANPRFVENAAPQVVEETREQAAQRREERDKLREALSRLGPIG